MRLLGVIPTLKCGGAERVMATMLDYWCQRGIESHLVLLTDDAPFYDVNPQIKVHHVNIFGGEAKAGKAIRSVTGALQLRRLIIDIDPCVAITFLMPYSLYALATMSGTSVKTIVSDRNNPTRRLGLATTLLRRILFPRANAVVAQTSKAQCFYQEMGCKYVAKIPNPIRLPPATTYSRDTRTILCVGRLEPQKGHRYLIDAFALADCQNWSLVIAGEGTQKESLKKQIRVLQIEQRVHLIGQTEAIDNYYQSASIFVLPSLREGFPNVLCEAMSFGLAVVAFDCDTGPAEIIDHEINGLLVRPGSTTDLANQITALANNARLRKSLGKNARKTAQRYQADRIMGHWDSLIGLLTNTRTEQVE